MEEVTCPGIVVKLLHITPLKAAPDVAWEGHCLSVDLPPAACTIHLCCSYQPSSLLERPQALRVDALQQQLYSSTTQQAIRTAMAAYQDVVTGSGPLASLPEDPLRLSDTMALVEFADSAGILLTSTAAAPHLILPPEGVTGLPDTDDEDAMTTLEGSNETQTDETMTALAARLLLTQILSKEGALCAPGHTAEPGQQIHFVWAEAVASLKVSPSLLLANMLLTSRREAAMFLRMATGFGFGQIGDYTASLFYLFRRRGHRLKCWECGVKKKAPCGKIARDDLPWCCHRRLGEWLPRLKASAVAQGGALIFEDVGTCFLTLLPPRDALESEDPLAMQLGYAPRTSDVVCLSDVLVDNPSHPRQPLRKALHRLAPTCRLLWANTPWISKTMHRMSAGKDAAAAAAHFWLEKTAFFKVPRNLQDEAMEQHCRPFEDLVEELLPTVKEAPVLGGHNRMPHAATISAGGALKHAPARVLTKPRGPRLGAADRAGSFPGGAFQPLRQQEDSRFTYFQPDGVSPAPGKAAGLTYTLGNSSSSDVASLGCFTQERLETSSLEERGWPNTGQGRRRLNARAALRAVGQKDLGVELSGDVLRASYGQPLPPTAASAAMLTADALQQPPVTPLPAAKDPYLGGTKSAQGVPGSAWPASFKLPPLRVVVNAGLEAPENPSSGLSSGGSPMQLSNSRQLLHMDHTSAFHPRLPTRFGSGRLSGLQQPKELSDEDDEWRPPRKLARVELPTAQSGTGPPRAGWRKPRTARLQFWNVQRKAAIKGHLAADDVGLDSQNSMETWSADTSRETSPRGCRAGSDDSPPREDDSNDCRSHGALQHLLHAVELAGMHV